MAQFYSNKFGKPWYELGKVLYLGCIGHDGSPFRHPIRPYRPGNCWDEDLVRSFLKRGETVIIVDFGYDYRLPETYNDIVNPGFQLTLIFD